MTDSESTSAAPAPSVATFTDAEIIDLVESWLRTSPDLRFGKVRAQGQSLRLEVTRRHFGEAKRRIGIPAAVAPHADHRRTVAGRAPETEQNEATSSALTSPPSPKVKRIRRRRGGRPVNLAGLSNLAGALQAIVAERDRARMAIDEIRRIVRALR